VSRAASRLQRGPPSRWLRLNLANDLELDAELVCCELVTNAVEHGGGAGTVRVEVMADGQVRVEVDDGDAAGVLTVGRSRLDASRGRGLMIVSSVARWGIRRSVSGKTVWATL
jgi:anti-sigma regulatory factor (Ser/Thr protein kinase)